MERTEVVLTTFVRILSLDEVSGFFKIDHGFKVERVIEDVCLADDDVQKHTNGWYGYEKAKMIPTTLIIKCLKQ